MLQPLVVVSTTLYQLTDSSPFSRQTTPTTTGTMSSVGGSSEVPMHPPEHTGKSTLHSRYDWPTNMGFFSQTVSRSITAFLVTFRIQFVMLVVMIGIMSQ